MKFKRYQHIEKLGSPIPEGIEQGLCYVFSKLDGSNASIWLDDNGDIAVGKRSCQMSVGDEFKGLKAYVESHEGIKKYLQDHPTHRLHGEWLIPHTFRQYKQEAWKELYIFDVRDGDTYINYDAYSVVLAEYNIEYIPCISTIQNGSFEEFSNCLAKSDFLLKEDCSQGEGIVIKNYAYCNKFGNIVWAKLITDEYKAIHKIKHKYSDDVSKIFEEIFVEEYCTEHLIEKTYAKIAAEKDGFTNKNIPQLLSTVYHDLIAEETWSFIKKNKNATINFKTLQFLVFKKVKEIIPLNNEEK